MMGLRDVRYEIGPFITLVDGPRFDEIWAERQHLIIGHLTGSELAAISRADRIDVDQIEAIKADLSAYHNDIIILGANDDSGVDGISAVLDD